MHHVEADTAGGLFAENVAGENPPAEMFVKRHIVRLAEQQTEIDFMLTHHIGRAPHRIASVTGAARARRCHHAADTANAHGRAILHRIPKIDSDMADDAAVAMHHHAFVGMGPDDIAPDDRHHRFAWIAFAVERFRERPARVAVDDLDAASQSGTDCCVPSW
jgi:hypothetical protein